MCLCVKCTKRSCDVGEITEENGHENLRTEFCRKSICRRQWDENMVNKKRVAGEGVRPSGL